MMTMGEDKIGELNKLYNAYSKLRLVGGEKDDEAVGTVLEFARAGTVVWLIWFI
jgi:hypothetical protein